VVASHVLENLLKEGRPLSVKDIQLLGLIRDLLIDILSKNPRYCFDSKHTCTYREHACYVEYVKGSEWTEEDILNCPYRQKIED
jgi:hypothetical protein